MEFGKEGYMQAQCPEKLAPDARRRQVVAAQKEILIVEELQEEKPAEN